MIKETITFFFLPIIIQLGRKKYNNNYCFFGKLLGLLFWKLWTLSDNLTNKEKLSKLDHYCKCIAIDNDISLLKFETQYNVIIILEIFNNLENKTKN